MTVKYIFSGDSWALKGFTDENWDKANQEPLPQDIRLADFWDIDYKPIVYPGKGNLSCLEKIVKANVDPDLPIVWIYTEPGRDYNLMTGRDEFEWITSEETFELRQQLDEYIMEKIANTLTNPVAFIGGLSDIDVELAEKHGFTVLHPSWQKWISEYCNSSHFQFGWGAGDIGWHADYDDVIPSKTALFAWDEQIKEWCSWEEHDMFCHEHPTIKANILFAHHLKQTALEWIYSHAK